jgi:hypothetical protein
MISLSWCRLRQLPVMKNPPIAYTAYTNSDLNLAASHVAISATVPVGTRYIITGSTPGWSCTSAEAGGNCIFALPTLAAKSSGSMAFTVLLDEDNTIVPNVLDLLVELTQGTPLRTAQVTLDEGETDLTVDAGIVHIDAHKQTETALRPTGLPPTGQPRRGEFIYLPSISSVKSERK